MADAIQLPDDSPEDSTSSVGDVSGAMKNRTRLDRTDLLSFLGAAAISFSGYWFTLSPDITLEWSGHLATAAAYAGVPAPPGYPIWTLYSWLFIHLLPFSNIAWRVAVSSAVAAAFASGLVALMVSRGTAVLFEGTPELTHLSSRGRNQLRGGCGVAAGLVLAFTGVIWGEAVIADFWALSVCLFAGVVCSLTFWMLEPERRRFLYVGFFLLGLLLTSSQEMIVTLPGLVGAVMLVDRKLGRDLALSVLPSVGLVSALFQWGIWIAFPGLVNWPMAIVFTTVGLAGLGLVAVTRSVGSEWKAALTCGICVFLGLAFCCYSPIASMTTPPVNWGYPRTVEGFFHVLARGQFEKANPTHEFGRYFMQLWLYVISAGKEFGWPQLVVSVLPFCALHRTSSRGRQWVFGLVAVWICTGPLIVAEYNPPPDRQAMELIAWYYMCSHVVLAIWLGLGLMVISTWATRPNACRN